MASVHLIKLSVGPESLSDLERWQQMRLQEKLAAGEKPELYHITRNTPRRAEALLDGGSIYWVIKGYVCARQKLLELRPVTYNGMPHCAIIYEPKLIRVAPRPHRPFQGWRYLDPKAAPADIGRTIIEPGSDTMLRELATLGLL
jgi:hypothetical protein